MQITPPGAFYVDATSDRAVVYMDKRSTRSQTGSLLFRPLTDGAVLGEPTYVAWQVLSLATVATPGALVYSVNTGGNDDGIYFHSGP